MNKKIYFTTLSLGENYTRDYTLRLIEQVLTLTNQYFAVATDRPDIIREKFPNEDRILIDYIDRYEQKIRLKLGHKDSWVDDFNFNMRYLCLRQLLDKEDCYIIWTDCDNSLVWWDEEIVQNFFKEMVDQGYGFLGPRTLWKLRGFLDDYNAQDNREYGIFWHKIYNYDLDTKPRPEWDGAPLPAEYLLAFTETGEKLKKFYNQFKWFHDYLANKEFTHGTWAEGFELGVSAYVAGYKDYDIGWHHPVLARALKANGLKQDGDPYHEKERDTLKPEPEQTKELKSEIEIIDRFDAEITENHKVILSLSTTPSKLHEIREGWGVRLVIEKLISLEYPNYEIHFNVPNFNVKINQAYFIPKWLEELEKEHEHLKVFRTEDYGSITKIVPTLQRVEDPDTVIITVDDDLEYVDGFIEYHLSKMKEHPGCALGFAGISAVDGSCHFCTTLPKDTRVKILEGYKTVSYLRKFFDDDFFSDFVGKSWSDDIVLSAYMGKQNIKKIVMNYDKDETFNPVVESFPVVRGIPNEQSGCFWFRSESAPDNSEQYYKLGYLER
jgi:hypothetical protein